MDHLQFNTLWEFKDPSAGYAVGSSNPLFLEPQYGMGYPISYITSITMPQAGLIAAITKDRAGNVSTDHYLVKNTQAMMENNLVWVASATDPPVAADGSHITMSMVGLKPTSRGSVSINSTDMADPPLLDPNYFDTEVDRYVWRVALRSLTSFMTGDTVFGQTIIAGETPPTELAPLTTNSTDEFLDSRVQAGGM